MKVFSLVPDTDVIDVKLMTFQDDKWDIEVEGAVGNDVKNSANTAVLNARDELHKHSNFLKAYIDNDKQRSVTFNLSNDSLSNGIIGTGFATRFTVEMLFRYLKDETENDIIPEYNIAVAGKIGFPEKATESVPIDPVDISLDDIKDAISSIEEHGVIILPEGEDLKNDDLISLCEENSIRIKRVATISDIISFLCNEGAKNCYNLYIEPLCQEMSELLADYISLEKENEKFQQYYMREVVQVFNLYQDLTRRYEFYSNQLADMKAAKDEGRPVSNICDEIRKTLKEGNPFTAGFDDLEEDEESPEETASYIDSAEDESGEAIDQLSDTKRRFKTVVMYATHPDHDGSVVEFQVARSTAEKQDILSIQSLILKYWPQYVSQEREEEIPEIDDMSKIDSVIRFIREAQNVRDEFIKRAEKRLEDDFTKERIVWEETRKTKNIDTVQEEKEGLISRSQAQTRKNNEVIRKVRKLCQEAKRPIEE